MRFRFRLICILGRFERRSAIFAQKLAADRVKVELGSTGLAVIFGHRQFLLVSIHAHLKMHKASQKMAILPGAIPRMSADTDLNSAPGLAVEI